MYKALFCISEEKDKQLKQIQHCAKKIMLHAVPKAKCSFNILLVKSLELNHSCDRNFTYFFSKILKSKLLMIIPYKFPFIFCKIRNCAHS